MNRARHQDIHNEFGIAALSPWTGSLRCLWLIGTIVLTCVSWSRLVYSQELENAIWNAVGASGHVVLMRHAIAPGIGDPPGFILGDCSTQRVLSDEGRVQAAKIGEYFRANGIRKARVFSSQWCRCLNTAKLLDLGPVRELPILNSFFERDELEQQQTQALRKWLAEQHLNEPLVLISHQVNITALTGVYPASGELVIIRRAEDGAISVFGTIKTD